MNITEHSDSTKLKILVKVKLIYQSKLEISNNKNKKVEEMDLALKVQQES